MGVGMSLTFMRLISICRMLVVVAIASYSSLSPVLGVDPQTKDAVQNGVVFSAIRYEGKISTGEARWEVALTVDSSSKQPVTVTLLEGDLALVSPRLPSGLNLEREGNRFLLTILKPGRYQFTLEVLSRIFRTDSWEQVSFTGPLAVISSISAEAKNEQIELELLTGTATETLQTNGLARVRGFLGADQTVALRWQSKKLEVTRRVVTAETTATAQATPTVIKFNTQHKLDIVQGKLTNFTVRLPASQTLTRLMGEQIRDWEIKNEGGNQILFVQFLKPIEDSYTLTLLSEQILEGTPTAASLTTPQPIEVERESGSFTLSAEDTLVEIESAVGLRQVNAPEGAVATYRFNGHPFNLDLRLRHIEPVLSVEDRVTTRLEERRLLVSHSLSVLVEKAGVYRLELVPPPGLLVSEVRSEGLEDWKISDGKIALNFAARVLGTRRIDLQLEKAFKDFPATIDVMPVRLTAATRETAQIGAASAPGIQLKTRELVGVREMSASKLAAHYDELLAYSTEKAEWKVTLASEKLGARIAADIFNLITIGDGLVGGSATIRYGLVNQGVQEFKLAMPANWRNVEFTGSNIRHKEQQGNVWTVSLQDKAWSAYTLVVTYDYEFPPSHAAFSVGGIHAIDAERETGSIAVTTAASLQLNVKSASESLRRIDETELAIADRSLITRSVLLAYRYTGNSYELRVDAKRFEQLPVLEAVADRTQLTTVLTESGEILTQASFMVKNNEKQFQRFQIPKGARFWSCHVNNQPAKPEKDGDWFLVPLPRTENRDEKFAVDIVYAEQKQATAALFGGSLQLQAPRTDVPNTYAEWELYAPYKLRLSGFEGNMTIARGTTYAWRDGWRKFTDFYKRLFVEIVYYRIHLIFWAGICVGLLALIVAGAKRGWHGLATAAVMLAVLGIIAAISIPNFVKARQTAQANTCVANLKQIDGAKEQWALENHKQPTDVPTWQDLVGADKYVKTIPDCPHGGEYTLNGLAHPPTCTLGAHNGHLLPGFEAAALAPGNPPANAASPAVPTQATLAVSPEAAHQSKPPMAAGIRSIRIDIPRTGIPLVFTKVLNVLDEPLAIKADIMKMQTFLVWKAGFQGGAFLGGLLLLYWQFRRNTRNNFFLTLGFALVLGAIIALLVSSRLLHLALIIGVPILVLLVLLKLIAKHLAKKKREVDTPLPGAGTAIAAIAFLLFAGPSVEAREKSVKPAVSARHVEPAAPATIISSDYRGAIRQRVAEFEVTLEVSAAQPNQTLSLFNEDLVIQRFVSRPEVKLVREGRSVGVVLPKKGSYTLEAKLLVKWTGDVTKRHLNFRIPGSLTSKLALMLDQAEAEVEFPSAVSFKKTTNETQTHIEGLLAGEHVDISWKPRVKRADEISSTVFSDSTSLVTFGNGMVNAKTAFRLQVTQGELRQIRIGIPNGQRLLRVDGNGIRTWTIDRVAQAGIVAEGTPAVGTDVLSIELVKGVSDEYRLTVETEKILDALPSITPVEIAHVLDIRRETGLIAVAGGEELTLQVENSLHLERVDAAEFERLTAKQHPGLFNAFRFLQPGFSLQVKTEAVLPQMEVAARNSFRLSADRILLSTHLDYTVKRAGVFSLKLVLPADYRVEQVSGSNVLQWVEREARTLEVTLKERTMGSYNLRVDLVKSLAALPPVLALSGVHPSEAVKVMGVVTVSAEPGIALRADSFAQLSEIPANNPGTLAFKFIATDVLAGLGWSLSVKPERMEAWLRAEIVNTISVTETLLSGRAVVRYEIQNAPAKELRLRIPAAFKNVEITGPNIRQRDQAGEIWKIELQNKISGSHTLTVTWDQARDSKTELIPVLGVGVDGVERESGVLAIAARPPLQVLENKADGLVKLDTREIPDWAGRPDNSVVLAYRFARPSYRLSVQAKHFDEAEVLQALVENVRLTSVVSDDGQTMTEFAFSIRNNGRQYLEIELPGNSEIWSAFVAGQPVRPSKREGKVLLPLEQANSGEAASVQLIYVGTNAFPRAKGAVAMSSPKLDVPLKDARWELYLPPDFDYGQFKGSMARDVSTIAATANFTLNQYEQQEAQRKAAMQSEVTSDLWGANYQLSKGNVREAVNDYNRAKVKGAAGRKDELKQLEKNLRAVQASNLINSQSEFAVRNNGQMAQAQTMNGKGGQELGNIYSNQAAEAQWTALEKAQEIAVARVQPLRVNLPIRGVRHTFSQVLQTEIDKAMTIEFAVAPTRNPHWWTNVLPAVLGFLALWTMVVWMNGGQKERAA